MSVCKTQCDGCRILKNVLCEKEEEIKELKLKILNLTTVLENCRMQSKRCRFCCDSEQHANENSSFEKLEDGNTESGIACHDKKSDEKLNCNSPVGGEISNLDNLCTDSSVVGKIHEDENTTSIPKDIYENLNHSEDYIYDEQSKMYYSVSTGFYYDTNTELFYVPQTGSYYKYNYSEHKYELFKKNEKTCDSNVTESCDSVTDKVDNLNINDCENFADSNSEQLSEEKSNYSNQHETSPVQKHYTININLTSEAVQPQPENAANEALSDSSKDWLPPAGSNATVKDLVTEVAEQNSGMSDYIYDEKCSMYYCRSNGNYYDPIRKLLYDPRARIYYLYIQETLSYEFYCKADAITDVSNQEVSTDNKDLPQKTISKAEARKKFWKKKQKESNEKEELFLENKEDSLQEDTNTVNDGFSSPEAGEIFSSDSETELMNESPVTPFKEESVTPCPPCIRAIVEYSSKLKVGSLILITCTGAIIGRENSNTVSVPDIGVSKIHAEITFDNESWKYSIEDLGSQNGTFVNEVRLSEPKQKSKPQVLCHGDKVAFGSCKLLIHIHEGYETCDECEPGQVMAVLSSKEVKATHVLKTKKEKEKERRQEMKRLKKKYGLKGMEYCDGKNCVPLPTAIYEDKAEIRRKTVGSQNPYEKTEATSMDSAMSKFNKGYQMLKKLGWKEGDSLGMKNSGISDPIPIRPWVGKAGFGCTEAQALRESLPEDTRKRKWVKAQERYFQLSS